MLSTEGFQFDHSSLKLWLTGTSLALTGWVDTILDVLGVEENDRDVEAAIIVIRN